MRIIETPVYIFNELNEKAKEKAREWYLRGMDYSWQWECTTEDAANIGLKITALYDHKSNEGEFIDGAFNCANKIVAGHGPDCDTHKTAQAFIKAWDEIPEHESVDEIEGEFLHALLEDYRIIYQKDIEYAESAQAVEESIEANEYEFTEEGERA